MIAYLESLARLETLNADIIFPAHGEIIHAPQSAIGKIRLKLLERESLVRARLSDGPKSVFQLIGTLFENPLLQFFPGCAITESHLIKLAQEGFIQRDGDRVVSVARVI